MITILFASISVFLLILCIGIQIFNYYQHKAKIKDFYDGKTIHFDNHLFRLVKIKIQEPHQEY